jgi:uncharacterized RDD family membrane protein YckC
MSEFEYDDRMTITTPEGVELSLTLAGVGSRFVAAALDALVEGSVLVAIYLLVFLTDGFGGGTSVAATIYAVAFFAVFWGYDVAFEVLASGRTPGKRWNGIRVVRTGGQPIGFLASATRNLVRLIDFLPSFYLVGIVSILVTRRNQRLGDLVAGSVVVREERAGIVSPTTRPVLPTALPDHLPGLDVSAVTAEEIATVRSFLERRHEIAPDARYQLAATMAGRLRPKVAGAPELQGEEFLEAVVRSKSSRG